MATNNCHRLYVMYKHDNCNFISVHKGGPLVMDNIGNSIPKYCQQEETVLSSLRTIRFLRYS